MFLFAKCEKFQMNRRDKYKCRSSADLLISGSGNSHNLADKYVSPLLF
jgi:hypothetical protein